MSSNSDVFENIHDLTGLDRRQCGQDLRYQRKRVAQLNTPSMEHDDSYIELRKGLLKRKIAITGEKHIKF